MTVPLFYARNPNAWLYNYALTSAYRAGFRVYDPDFGLSRDPDVWEKIRRDPIVAHALEIRTHQIAGRDWNVDPASDRPEDKQAADVIEELLKNIENFQSARYTLAQAVAVARSYAYISGVRKSVRLNIGDGIYPAMDWWVPKELRHVDRRRVYYEPIWDVAPSGERTLRLKMKLWSVARGQFEDWINPDYFVKVLYADEEGRLGYGRGLIEAIYHYAFIKGKVLAEGIAGLERWAQGMVHAKIEGLREASTGKYNEKIGSDWLKLLEKMRSRHVAVIDNKDEIGIVQPSGTGESMVTEFLTYLDNAITRLILGAVLPSGGDEGSGSFARAQVETNTMEALIQFDRQVMDEALTRDLIGLVWKLNRVQLHEIGLGNARMPKFRTVHEERANPALNAQVATMLLQAGVPIRVDELFRKVGFARPSEEDDVMVMRNGRLIVTKGSKEAFNAGAEEIPEIGEDSGAGEKSIALPSLPAIKEV